MKIINITADTHGNVYGLTSDGTVARWNFSRQQWFQ